MVNPWLWGIPLVLITVEAQVWEMWYGKCIGMNCIHNQRVELIDDLSFPVYQSVGRRSM